MDLDLWRLAIHAFATLLMTGLIWFVQIVHYPLFIWVARGGDACFLEYEREHTRRTTWIVAPLMLVETATSLWIAFVPPEGVRPMLAWSGAVLLAGVWASTFFWQVALHQALTQAFCERKARELVLGNWVRTALWTLRGVLAIGFLAAGVQGQGLDSWIIEPERKGPAMIAE